MDHIEEIFVGLIKQVSATSGMDDLTTSVFGILYLEPTEVAMDEVAKRTGYSLASISNKIKMLEAAGIVTRVSKPGTKKVFLYAEKDMFKITKNILLRKQKYCINATKEGLPSVINEVKSKIKSQKDKDRLKIIENYQKQVLKSEQLINEMLERVEEIEKD